MCQEKLLGGGDPERDKREPFPRDRPAQRVVTLLTEVSAKQQGMGGSGSSLRHFRKMQQTKEKANSRAVPEL